jgi:parvulin-like peptidyl-prolyl isomerase
MRIKEEPGGMMKGLLIMLAAALLILSCTKGEKAGEVLAKVDDSALTTEEFYNQIPPGWKDVLSFDEKRSFVNDWIETELLFREARRRGLDRDPKVVAQFETIKKEILKNELLLREMDKAKITDEIVQKYYEDHEEDYKSEIKIGIIFVDSKNEAEQIHLQLMEGEDFQALAKEKSLGPMAQEGGVVDYFRRHSPTALISPELEEIAFSLEEGDLSDVIETENGYYIVRMIDRKNLRTPLGFDDVQEDIRRNLSMVRQNNVYATLLDELKSDATIEINEGHLRE